MLSLACSHTHLPRFAQWVQTKIALGRIFKFLELPELTENVDDVPEGLLRNGTPLSQDIPPAVALTDATFSWEEPPPDFTAPKRKGNKGKKGNKGGADAGEASEAAASDAAESEEARSARGDSRFTLSDVDLLVPRGKLVAVVGPVGSGKSTLLSAILGEVPRRKGDLYRTGSVAYVAQQAWILNQTLRNNVTFGAPDDEARFEESVRVSALQQDIEVRAGRTQTHTRAHAYTPRTWLWVYNEPLLIADAILPFSRCCLEAARPRLASAASICPAGRRRACRWRGQCTRVCTSGSGRATALSQLGQR